MCEALLGAGDVDFESQDCDGHTALHLAARALFRRGRFGFRDSQFLLYSKSLCYKMDVSPRLHRDDPYADEVSLGIQAGDQEKDDYHEGESSATDVDFIDSEYDLPRTKLPKKKKKAKRIGSCEDDTRTVGKKQNNRNASSPASGGGTQKKRKLKSDQQSSKSSASASRKETEQPMPMENITDHDGKIVLQYRETKTPKDWFDTEALHLFHCFHAAFVKYKISSAKRQKLLHEIRNKFGRSAMEEFRFQTGFDYPGLPKGWTVPTEPIITDFRKKEDFNFKIKRSNYTNLAKTYQKLDGKFAPCGLTEEDLESD
jgi:hypothetical protein